MYNKLNIFLLLIVCADMELGYIIKPIPTKIKYDVVLFEDAYFGGKYIKFRVKPFDCINLLNDWANKASSMLTNGCVVFHFEFNCKANASSQLFSSVNFNFYEVYFSRPDKIPNLNFSGSG